MSKYIYGPVPSRRLGRSLGVDLVPFKVCSLDCVYCQLGATTEKSLQRKPYVSAETVLNELKELLDNGVEPDIISLAGSGEPTLNNQIGEVIKGIKSLTSIPVAVLTNGTLLWDKKVRQELMSADMVMPSLDAGDEEMFRKVNRPCKDLAFDRYFDGLVSFFEEYKGIIRLEVMLLGGNFDINEKIEKIAEAVHKLNPAYVDINTVCRPPCEEEAIAIPQERLEKLAGLFPGKVEIISTHRSSSSEAVKMPEAEAVISLIRRRPCTVSDVAEGLNIHAASALKILEGLVEDKKAEKTRSVEKVFYAAVN